MVKLFFSIFYSYSVNSLFFILFSLPGRLFWFKDIFVDKTDDKISNKTQCLGSVTDGFIKDNKNGLKIRLTSTARVRRNTKMHFRSFGDQPTETWHFIQKHLRSWVISIQSTQKSVVRTFVSASIVVVEGSSLTLRSMSTMLVEMARAVAVSWEDYGVVNRLYSIDLTFIFLFILKMDRLISLN